MLFFLRGIVRGRQIELERETGLPDGASVTVQINEMPTSIEEQRRRIDELCGAWADDPPIEAIFAEIEHERSTRLCRDIELDAPS